MPSVKIVVHGFVQGVGYRAYVKGVAESLGVSGRARNMPDGSVEIIASASEKKLAEFEKRIVVRSKSGPDVLSIEKHEAEEPIAKKGFEIT